MDDNALFFERNHGCDRGECGIRIFDVIDADGVTPMVGIKEGVTISHALEVLRAADENAPVFGAMIDDCNELPDGAECPDAVCFLVSYLGQLVHLEPDTLVSPDSIRRGAERDTMAWMLDGLVSSTQ